MNMQLKSMLILNISNWNEKEKIKQFLSGLKPGEKQKIKKLVNKSGPLELGVEAPKGLSFLRRFI